MRKEKLPVWEVSFQITSGSEKREKKFCYSILQKYSKLSNMIVD